MFRNEPGAVDDVMLPEKAAYRLFNLLNDDKKSFTGKLSAYTQQADNKNQTTAKTTELQRFLLMTQGSLSCRFKGNNKSFNECRHCEAKRSR